MGDRGSAAPRSQVTMEPKVMMRRSSVTRALSATPWKNNVGNGSKPQPRKNPSLGGGSSGSNLGMTRRLMRKSPLRQTENTEPSEGHRKMAKGIANVFRRSELSANMFTLVATA